MRTNESLGVEKLSHYVKFVRVDRRLRKKLDCVHGDRFKAVHRLCQ